MTNRLFNADPETIRDLLIEAAYLAHSGIESETFAKHADLLARIHAETWSLTKPENVSTTIWDMLTSTQKRAVVKHEQMHAETRAFLAYLNEVEQFDPESPSVVTPRPFPEAPKPSGHLTVADLLSKLMSVPPTAHVNITLQPHGDVAQDFPASGVGFDNAVDMLDLFVDLPPNARLMFNMHDNSAPEATTASEPRKVWSSGWNVPGYLPETEPMDFETWGEAVDALADELYHAEQDRLETDDEDGREMYAAATKRLRDAEPDTDWWERIGNYVWWVQQVVLPEEN